MIVYRITNKINGKVYIGKTVKPLTRRWQHHKRDARGESQVYFHRAIRKHGPESFIVEPVYVAKTEKELAAMETFFIVLHQSYKPENGYNGTLGGDGIGLLTDETRQRMRDAKTPEIRRRMSERMMGVPLSIEHCRRIGDSKRGEKNPHWGKPRSEETRRRIGKAQLGKKLSPEHREKIGKAHQGKALSEEHRLALSEAHKGLVFSDEHRKNLSQALSGERNVGYGTKWVSKDSETIRIPSHLLDSYVEQGWTAGRASLLGKKPPKERIEKVLAYWTPERRAQRSEDYTMRRENQTQCS